VKSRGIKFCGGIVGARNKFFVASALAISDCAAKTSFHAPTIPPATQAKMSAAVLVRVNPYVHLFVSLLSLFYLICESCEKDVVPSLTSTPYGEAITSKRNDAP